MEEKNEKTRPSYIFLIFRKKIIIEKERKKNIFLLLRIGNETENKNI